MFPCESYAGQTRIAGTGVTVGTDDGAGVDGATEGVEDGELVGARVATLST